MCYGLRTDSNGDLFEGSARLLAVADRLTEVKNTCHCGKKARIGKWWEDDAEAVPSSAAAGSWEGAVTNSSAAETWDWTDPGPNTPGAWWEEVPRRGSRPGSAQTPGKGELLGYRWRFNPWTGKEFWSEKRAKVLPPGRTPHRSGAIPPSGNLVEMAQLANESGEITCFTRLLWPH
jgi:hypothetical protein